MVLKAKQFMDPLGKCLFLTQMNNPTNPKVTRSTKSNKIAVPVHGYPELVVSLMATAWNENSDLCNGSKGKIFFMYI